MNRNFGKTYFMLGADRAWPHKMFAASAPMIGKLGGHVVGEEFTSGRETDFSPLIARIAATKANVLLFALKGDGLNFIPQADDLGAYLGQHLLVRPGRDTDKMQQRLMLGCRPCRGRLRRHRLHALALTGQYQSSAIVTQWTHPIRVSEHTRKTIHIRQKSCFGLIFALPIHVSTSRANPESSQIVDSRNRSVRPSDSVRLARPTRLLVNEERNVRRRIQRPGTLAGLLFGPTNAIALSTDQSAILS